jgi:short-subunit dehydrogenase
MDIAGKVVIITGASAGIGAAAARAFAKAGAKLVLAARSADKLEALAGELTAQGYTALVVPTDMRDPASVLAMVDAAVKHYGTVDVLINNAGQGGGGRVEDVLMDDFRELMALNVYGVVEAMQAVAPIMRKAGGGSIINISSMLSKMAIPGLGVYAATKAALNMLSDTARAELAPDHIRVTTVYPRMTATDFGRNARGSRGAHQERRTPRPAGDAPQIDSAEYVARRILQAAQTEAEEQFME